jgi:ATP-dependent protease ClpP protease subunit
MTLLIAQKQADGGVWMLADTAITDNKTEPHERAFTPKVFPVQGGRALAGFAGDLDTGLQAIADLEQLPDARSAIAHLLARRRGHQSLGFAYAWFDVEPRLAKVDHDKVEEVPTLHLGDDKAFESFQRIRHDPELVHPPDALTMLQLGVRDPGFRNDGATDAVAALWLLMASRTERDVGGWVLPYALTSNGASLLSYAYSTSDPILNHLLPGDIIPHGSAAGGGFSFSLTELSDHSGFVAYWLQQPGGFIYRKREGGSKFLKIQGDPLEFKERAAALLGFPIDIWFGDSSPRPVVDAVDMPDESGRRRTRRLTHDDGSYSYQWMRRTPDSFRLSQTFDLGDVPSPGPLPNLVIHQPSVRKEPRMPTTFRLVFNAPLNLATLNSLQSAVSQAIGDPDFSALELLVASPGGLHDAAFNLYGFFRSLPLPVHVHVIGSLNQMAVPAFLAGTRRTCVPDARFGFFPVEWTFGGSVQLASIETAIRDLRRDVALAKEIFRRHAKVPDERLDEFFGAAPANISAQEALDYGIVHEILNLNPDGTRQHGVRVITIGARP